jgi:hypothetical protein
MSVNNTESSGGTRFSQGKPVATWAPWSGMKEVLRVSEKGATKYAPFDWKNGQSFSTLVNSGTRHLLELLEHGPTSRDPETGCMHAGHLAWNILALLAFIEMGRTEELDDISPWLGITTFDKLEAMKVAEQKEIPLLRALKELKDERNAGGETA